MGWSASNRPPAGIPGARGARYSPRERSPRGLAEQSSGADHDSTFCFEECHESSRLSKKVTNKVSDSPSRARHAIEA
jgi:hypothetical protein